MRLDRLITLSLVHPLRHAWSAVRGPVVPSSRSPVVPILMYHSITDAPEPGVSPYYQVNTAPSVFRQHMQFLADHGYRTLTLGRAVELLCPPRPSDGRGIKGEGQLPSSINPSIHKSNNHQPSTTNQQLVVLTFDDGFRNFYTEAFPVLQEFGFTATIFLPTAYIQGSKSCSPVVSSSRSLVVPSSRSPFRLLHPDPNDFLTWDQVRSLHRSGIEFGSHTVTHPKLVDLNWPEIEFEISNSKSEIEQQLGEPIKTFCYPYAFPQNSRPFVERFTELLRESGYACCATTQLGRLQAGDNAYRLKRLPANSLDDLPLLAAKLTGCYDWLAGPQAFAKKFWPHALASSNPITNADEARLETRQIVAPDSSCALGRRG